MGTFFPSWLISCFTEVREKGWDGIVELLENELLHDFVSQQCRAIAVQEYRLDLYGQKHIELGRQLLQN